MERMIEDSFKFASDDVTARKLIEARLDAGAMITATEKSLLEGGHLVARDNIAATRTALAALTAAKDGSRSTRHPCTHGGPRTGRKVSDRRTLERFAHEGAAGEKGF